MRTDSTEKQVTAFLSNLSTCNNETEFTTEGQFSKNSIKSRLFTKSMHQHTCTAKDCESCWLVSESSIPESLLGFAKEASERARLAGPPPTASSAFRLPESNHNKVTFEIHPTPKIPSLSVLTSFCLFLRFSRFFIFRTVI